MNHKKIMSAFTAFALCLTLAGCGQSNPKTEEPPTEAAAEALTDPPTEEPTTQQPTTQPPTKAPTKSSDLVKVKLENMEAHTGKYGIYNYYLTFSFKITNNTKKDIKGIQGVATFNDMFGSKIESFNCNFTDFSDGSLPSGYYCTYNSLSVGCNEYSNDDMKLFGTPYEDIKFEYDITSIVYTDGTSETF